MPATPPQAGSELSRRKAPPLWNTFYILDPTRLNRVVPPTYVFMVIGLTLSVQHPFALLAICAMVTIANVGLAVWVQRYGQNVTPFQRVEAIRLVLNAIVDGILIYLYVDEAPVWCLSLTGALVFSTIWSGKAMFKAYGLHLVVLMGAMFLVGQPLGPISVMVSIYVMCASVTVFFMDEVRTTIAQRSEASALALALQDEQYARDVADHRREALSSTNQLASSLAHEVNNPLFAVIGNLEFCPE